MNNVTGKIVSAILFGLLFFSCNSNEKGVDSTPPINPGIVIKPAIPFLPAHYICYMGDSITIDGLLDEKAWQSIPWSSEFSDIEGTIRSRPLYPTRVKLLWDNNYLYIAAEMKEPHIWAYLTQRDTVIFYDNDFEVFIDPDGDSHGYYEIEINAANTVWDLLLTRPYRDKGKVIDSWDITGLKSSVKIFGTLNDPDDTDDRWVAELALPMSVLTEWGTVPSDSVTWRINFSRVNWQTEILDGKYVKKIAPVTGYQIPEYNWVWSPQGVINMHYPEMWGYLQFSTIKAGQGDTEYIPDPDSDLKWSIRTLYYAQRVFATKNGYYSANHQELLEVGFESYDTDPMILITFRGYEAYLVSQVTGKTWIIDDTGRLSPGN